jgi:hypothetical protein
MSEDYYFCPICEERVEAGFPNHVCNDGEADWRYDQYRELNWEDDDGSPLL